MPKAKATKNNGADQVWPDSINLAERLPADHDRANQLRYATTNNGKGRMDMLRWREVPQPLVDAALQKQMQGVSRETKTASA